MDIYFILSPLFLINEIIQRVKMNPMLSVAVLQSSQNHINENEKNEKTFSIDLSHQLKLFP